jgi:hypothetical protein
LLLEKQSGILGFNLCRSVSTPPLLIEDEFVTRKLVSQEFTVGNEQN